MDDKAESTRLEFDLRACLGGDTRAWAAFVERFAPVIHAAVSRTFRARGAQREEAAVEDAAQDVFVRLVRDGFRLLRSFDPARASLVTWLTIVARSAALDHLRKRRLPALSLDETLHDQARPADQVPEELELPPGVLTDRQKLVLRLLFEKDLSVAQAASAMNVDEQTVRSTKHKALARLRQHFSQESGP